MKRPHDVFNCCTQIKERVGGLNIDSSASKSVCYRPLSGQLSISLITVLRGVSALATVCTSGDITAAKTITSSLDKAAFYVGCTM